MKKRLSAFLMLVVVSGCSTRIFSNTPRTAIEQLLLTAAVDKAVEKIELPEVAGKKVFVDTAALKAFDAEYIKVAVRARFARIGAILVPKDTDADYVAEVASGCEGTEYKSGMIGLPPIPVPNSSMPTPELAFYRKVEQTGILKLLIFVHDKGKFVASGQYYAKADRDEAFILFFRFQHRDDVRKGWQRAQVSLKEK